MMRASLLLLATAFDLDESFERPTEDPEEMEEVLLDEYASDAGVSRSYRSLLANATNTTPPIIMPEPPTKASVPWVPIAGVAAVGAAGGAYFMTRPTFSTETFEYEVEDGLMEEFEYDEEYEYEEEEYFEDE
jgi:hypothetical protein